MTHISGEGGHPLYVIGVTVDTGNQPINKSEKSMTGLKCLPRPSETLSSLPIDGGFFSVLKYRKYSINRINQREGEKPSDPKNRCVLILQKTFHSRTARCQLPLKEIRILPDVDDPVETHTQSCPTTSSTPVVLSHTS
ncbi:hypothetical protein BDB01DRAFT_839477 [Pilobolus umbonatus]|nr:hypothetical protein BDB01DRAFT_839477 [Pilobolus umbonatus]